MSPKSLRLLPLLVVLLCVVCSGVSVAAGARAHTHRSISDSSSLSHARGLAAPAALTLDPNAVTLSVLDYGAKGDGSNFDNTQAFQNALNAAEANAANGNVWPPSPTVVFVPRGIYYFAGTLTIAQGVSLAGSYLAAPAHTYPQPHDNKPPTDGTVLMVTAGRGAADGTSFITMEGNNAAVRGISFFYPEQMPKGTPQPYPFTIMMNGYNTALTDCEFINAYQAVAVIRAARHQIARLMGQPLLTGILVDQIYDIGRIQDVHWNPWWSSDVDVGTFQATNMRCFVFQRTDWEYVLNTFCFLSAIGYHFNSSEHGGCNGNFVGIGSDMSVNATVQVDGFQPAGLQIVNAEFTAFGYNSSWCPSCRGPNRHIVVNGGHGDTTGSVRIVNSNFWGPAERIAWYEGAGILSFEGCSFMQWGLERNIEPDTPAITAHSGSLQVTNCAFQRNASQIEMGPDVKRAVITGNIIDGSLRIRSQAQNKGSNIIIANNAADDVTIDEF